jgi:hypothetical protein
LPSSSSDEDWHPPDELPQRRRKGSPKKKVAGSKPPKDNRPSSVDDSAKKRDDLDESKKRSKKKGAPLLVFPKGNWVLFRPKTNILWLCFLLQTLVRKVQRFQGHGEENRSMCAVFREYGEELVASRSAPAFVRQRFIVFLLPKRTSQVKLVLSSQVQIVIYAGICVVCKVGTSEIWFLEKEVNSHTKYDITFCNNPILGLLKPCLQREAAGRSWVKERQEKGEKETRREKFLIF